jgi:DNA-binding PucR family transcriptional regulator
MLPRASLPETGNEGDRMARPAQGRGPDAIVERLRQDGMPVRFLGGYLEMLVGAVTAKEALGAAELDRCRKVGIRAAQEGISFHEVVDLYLRATWLTWSELSTRWGSDDGNRLRRAAGIGFKTANSAVVALADGYEGTQRRAIRQEEASRREFVDDLLYGRADLGRLAERAQRFGLRLSDAYTAIVASAGEELTETSARVRSIEAVLAERYGVRDILLTVRDGLLVCIAPSAQPDLPDELARLVRDTPTAGQEWRIGIGRSHPGPGGVVHSYAEARGAVDLADRLGLDTPIVKAADLLVFQVLLRDRAAISELVSTVLGPLRSARGGVQPMLDTLASYFTSHGVAAVARDLNLSVRAVSYRLERISKLTGYSISDPYQRFTLEAAVLGARILNWPDEN